MTKTEEFWKWAEEELEKRKLSWYAVERQSGLSNATISRRARELLPPTYETCRAIAQVFRLPLENVLRYAGLLHGNIQGDVCANSGIMTGKDAVRMILAGASCVQIVSTLYKNKISSLANLIKETESWMDGKGYQDIAAFRGKMDAKNNQDPGFYRRAQYVKNLIKADYAS